MFEIASEFSVVLLTIVKVIQNAERLSHFVTGTVHYL